MANDSEEKTTETKASAKAVTVVVSREEKIEAWFVKHFTGNRISADTDTYNICHAAKEDLKTLL